MVDFEGTWKLETSDNFENYLRAVGIGYLQSKIISNVASTAGPLMIIKKDADDIFTVRSQTSYKSNEISFKIGEQFDETAPDGRKCKTTVRFTEGKLVQQQDGDIPSTLTRELIDSKTLAVICEAEGVVYKRIYRRIE